MCHHLSKHKKENTILESFIPMESEFGFLEHDLYKLIEVERYIEKAKYHLL